MHVLASFSTVLLIALLASIFLAGAVNGVAGFGFALVGTMVMATVIEPSVAVVFMIVPIVAVNVSLVSELSPTQLRRCGVRFYPLFVAAFGGTIVGMVLIDVLPADSVRVSLGIVSLAFVISAQEFVRIPGLQRTREGCFVESMPAMIGVGGLSGVLFGGTNVGVQLVAYMRSCDLSHGLFVGVIAMLFLGLNSIRVGIAGMLGLYPSLTIVGLSVAASIPAVLGVVVGRRLRNLISPSVRSSVVMGLLTLIGVRLLWVGLF